MTVDNKVAKERSQRGQGREQRDAEQKLNGRGHVLQHPQHAELQARGRHREEPQRNRGDRTGRDQHEAHRPGRAELPLRAQPQQVGQGQRR